MCTVCDVQCIMHNILETVDWWQMDELRTCIRFQYGFFLFIFFFYVVCSKFENAI